MLGMYVPPTTLSLYTPKLIHFFYSALAVAQGHCLSISVMVKTLMNEIKRDESTGSEVTTFIMFYNGYIVKWPTHLVGQSTISHGRSPWS